MQIADWTRFTKRIPIHAEPQAIYDLWTTQEGLEKWFLRKAEFKSNDRDVRAKNSSIQKGDKFEWFWYGYPNSVVEQNIVTEANGKDFLQFKFSGECLVSVYIKQEEGESLVELTQENIPLDENPATNMYIGCCVGWTFYLANLKSLLEGGIDLRNKNTKLTNVINS